MKICHVLVTDEKIGIYCFAPKYVVCNQFCCDETEFRKKGEFLIFVNFYYIFFLFGFGLSGSLTLKLKLLF